MAVRSAGLQRVNVWAHVFMASFQCAVGTVRSLQGTNYLTTELNRLSRKKGQPGPLKPVKSSCSVRMERFIVST